MSEKNVISMFSYLVNRDEEVFLAVKSAMERPFPRETNTEKLPTREQMVSWFLQGLWLEGYKIVRASDDDGV